MNPIITYLEKDRLCGIFLGPFPQSPEHYFQDNIESDLILGFTGDGSLAKIEIILSSPIYTGKYKSINTF